jgi:hypothetical protein
MLEGGAQGSRRGCEDVVGASQIRDLQKRVQEFERQVGRRTNEILKEALEVVRVKNRRCRCRPGKGQKTLRSSPHRMRLTGCPTMAALILPGRRSISRDRSGATVVLHAGPIHGVEAAATAID